jgi:hypothetical protein
MVRTNKKYYLSRNTNNKNSNKSKKKCKTKNKKVFNRLYSSLYSGGANSIQKPVSLDLSVINTNYPVNSLVKVIKFNKILTAIKNTDFKDQTFYAKVLKEAELIDNKPKILIGFRNRQNQKNSETTYIIDVDAIQLLNEDEKQEIQKMYNTLKTVNIKDIKKTKKHTYCYK